MIEWLLKFTDSEAMEAFAETAREVLADGEVNLCCWWVYLLAAAVTVCTVYFSLARPMHMAAKVSEVEAMRMQTAGKNRRSRRKGYEFLSIGRLTLRNLTENKKKTKKGGGDPEKNKEDARKRAIQIIYDLIRCNLFTWFMWGSMRSCLT